MISNLSMRVGIWTDRRVKDFGLMIETSNTILSPLNARNIVRTIAVIVEVTIRPARVCAMKIRCVCLIDGLSALGRDVI